MRVGLEYRPLSSFEPHHNSLMKELWNSQVYILWRERRDEKKSEVGLTGFNFYCNATCELEEGSDGRNSNQSLG